ncbi:MAG: hypothetical protein AAGJ70_11640 [Pseudomonadota bacterium]
MTIGPSRYVPPRIDARTYDEFMRELRDVRRQPLDAQLRFMRNAMNRDRALSIPRDTLTRLLRDT